MSFYAFPAGFSALRNACNSLERRAESAGSACRSPVMKRMKRIRHGKRHAISAGAAGRRTRLEAHVVLYNDMARSVENALQFQLYMHVVRI